jgi:hypothetical protein
MKKSLFPVRFSYMGKGLVEAVIKDDNPFSAEQLIVSGSVGVHICSRLPGDMGLRLGEVVSKFLDDEHRAGRLSL